jgi:hypothetical protein
VQQYTSFSCLWCLHLAIDSICKGLFTSHIDKKISLTFFLTSLSLYIFTIWKCIAYNRFCRDGIYFDKILVSEYKLFKRSNKANLAIILISWNVIFIWETGYWTRSIKRFALFDLLKSLYSDTKILSSIQTQEQNR